MLLKPANLGYAALIAFALVFSIAGCDHHGSATRDIRKVRSDSFTSDPNAANSASSLHPLLVEAISVHPERLETVRTISGEARPWSSAVLSAETSGRAMSRPVQVGDRVRQGELVAEIDPELALANLRRFVASREQANAARRQAESDYSRALIETRASQELAKAQVRQALAGGKQSEAQVIQANETAKKTASITRRQELRQAQALLSQAKTDEKLARIELDRYATLVAEGAAPRQELDRRQATYDLTVAKRESAEESLSLATEGARFEDVAVAKAQLLGARANSESAKSQIDGAQATLEIANTRQLKLASIRQQILGLKAQEKQAVEATEAARIDLKKHRMVAPFSGRVTAVSIERGDLLSPGTPVLKMAEIDRLKVAFAIPEAEISGLRVGKRVSLAFDALKGRSFFGRIHSIGVQSDPRSRAFQIEVEFLNRDEAVLPGMVARLKLESSAKSDLIQIPISAVGADNSGSFVYLLQNNRAIRREIKLGAPSGEKAQAIAGLNGGETIAASPQRLTDGAAVILSSR